MASNQKSFTTTAATDEYSDVNADANSLKEGIQLLQQLVAKPIAKLSSEPSEPIQQYFIPSITRIINDYVKLFPKFHKDEKVVEAWGLIWAYRDDGKLLWNLKVVWGTFSVL